jgi:hypothetical protein
MMVYTVATWDDELPHELLSITTKLKIHQETSQVCLQLVEFETMEPEPQHSLFLGA